jgi:hypothetical protein
MPPVLHGRGRGRSQAIARGDCRRGHRRGAYRASLSSQPQGLTRFAPDAVGARVYKSRGRRRAPRLPRLLPLPDESRGSRGASEISAVSGLKDLGLRRDAARRLGAESGNGA